MPVYLPHLSRKLKHAGHYCGWVPTMARLAPREAEHRAGTGARFLQVVVEQGIDFHLVRVWEHGDRNLERRIKNWNDLAQFCPECNPRAMQHMAMD